jgi:hypothetical protein
MRRSVSAAAGGPQPQSIPIHGNQQDPKEKGTSDDFVVNFIQTLSINPC